MQLPRRLSFILITGLAIQFFSCDEQRQVQIGIGFKLHAMCSGLFYQGLSVDKVEENLAHLNPILNKIPVTVNRSKKTVSVLGLKSATYNKGFGCTIKHSPSLRMSRKPKLTTRLSYGQALEDESKNISQYVTDPKKMQDIFEWVFEEDRPDKENGHTRSLIIVYKDKIIAQKHARGYTENTPQIGWSATKSVTAVLAAQAIEQGLFTRDAEIPPRLSSFIKDRSTTTMDDLLKMRLGLVFEEDYDNYESDVYEMLLVQPDMAKYVLSKERVAAPGEKYKYSTGTSQVVSASLREFIGDDKTFWNFPAKHLFAPLGMSSAEFTTDSTGTFVGGAWLYLSALDWAKFGVMIKNKGVSHTGTRVLTEETMNWLTEATNGTDYGRHFAVNKNKERWEDLPETAYGAMGHFHQKVLAVPSKDLVIVRLGLTTSGGFELNRLAKEVIAILK